MINSYIFSKNNLYPLANPPIISFMYTEIQDDPSLIHSHPYTEILIPKNGYGILSCNGENIPINQHSLYIIPPNISHTETNTHSINHFKYYTIKLQDLIISPTQENDNLIILNLEDSYNEIHSYLAWALLHLNKQDNEQLIALISI